MALLFNGCLYFYYKSLAKSREKRSGYQFIYNSMYLGQFRKLQQIFFIAIIVDSFFAQTIIQLFNLTCVLIILALWAFTTPKSDVESSAGDKKLRDFRNKMIDWSTTIIKVFTNLQLFCLSFFSLQVISSWLNLRLEPADDKGQINDSKFYKIMQSLGLLPNPEMRSY